MSNTTISPTGGAVSASGRAPTGMGLYTSPTYVPNGFNQAYLTEVTTREQLITSLPARVYGIYPAATTNAAITLREADAPTNPIRIQAAAAMTTQGQTYYQGIDFMGGVTVQLVNSADKSVIAWTPLTQVRR